MRVNKLIPAFAGTYSLINQTETINGVPSNRTNPMWGTGAIGLITYTADGYMAATLATSDPDLLPKNVTSPPQPGQTDQDWALVGRHTLSYAGHWSINETFPSDKNSGQILHGPLTVANIPTWIGTTQRRNYVATYKHGEIDFLKFILGGANGLRVEIFWKKLV